MIETPGGKYFVTGAAGFIGSHLVDRLLSEGHTVTGYDNLSLGRREYIAPVLRNHRFTFIEADLLDLEMLTKCLRGHDVVFHLAANTDIPGGNRDPSVDFKHCIVGTFNLLEAMRAGRVRDLLFASSSTVFGEPEVRPTPETIGPPLPISMYGAGKLAGEGLISAYCHLYGLRAWIFRFGNVVGARMTHGVIYDFIAKLRENPAELEILGDGNQEKNYFLVEDCLDGMIFAFVHTQERVCDVFNLGTETTTSTTEIACLVVQELGLRDVRFRYTGGRQGWPGDVPVVKYDLTKMTRLGWRARYTSTEALRIATRRLLGAGEPV